MSSSLLDGADQDLDMLVPSSQPSTSPSLLATQPVDASNLDSIPPLTTAITNSTPGRTAALKLIADSIAQQRQIASYALITHPLNLAIYALIIVAITKCLYHEASDLGLLFTTAAGGTMACLIAIRGACSGYISAAEEINHSYLDNQEDSGEEILITSIFGTETIGTLVLHLQPTNFRNSPPSSPEKPKRSHHNNHHKGGKALIRAWTVSLRYRRRGMGTALLEEAVKVAREKLGRDAKIGFSVAHANSLRVLPRFYNGKMVKREQQAGSMLEHVVERFDSSGRKRR